MYYKLDGKLTGDIDIKMEISSINLMKALNLKMGKL